MRRIFIPLPPRLPLRAAGPLAVSVITPFPPSPQVPAGPIINIVKQTVRHSLPSAGLALLTLPALARPPIERAVHVDGPAGIPEVPAAQFGDCLLEVVERLEAP